LEPKLPIKRLFLKAHLIVILPFIFFFIDSHTPDFPLPGKKTTTATACGIKTEMITIAPSKNEDTLDLII